MKWCDNKTLSYFNYDSKYFIFNKLNGNWKIGSNIDKLIKTMPNQPNGEHIKNQKIFNIVMGAIAGISLLVGGIGIMNIMYVSVTERTREIGVMRSIGAADRSIISIVIVEGVTVGLISMLFGGILAIPITQVLDYVVGMAFIESPVRFIYSLEGVIWWLVLILVLSVVASILPARNAVRLTIRDVLAYE